jgi:hypothetical protein
LTEKYKLARDDYNELKKITSADKQMSDARIAELTNAIGRANEIIVRKEAEIAQKTERIKVLSRDLADLIANEPVQPELESQPLVISLRSQVKTLTSLYSLSQQTVTLLTAKTDALLVKCNALESIGTEWKQQYDKERALRLSAEGMFKIAEHELKVNKFWGKAKNVAIVTIAGGLAYSIFKKG